MAVYDKELLADLLGDIEFENKALDGLLNSMLEEIDVPEGDGELTDPEDAPDNLPGAHALKPDMVFDGDPIWGMPLFREDMLAEIPKPIEPWAGPDVSKDDGADWFFYQWRSDSMKGMPLERTLLGFYVDDYRFDCFFVQPEKYVAKLLNLGISVAVTPNYSLYPTMPRCVQLFQTFKARWVGCYLQEAGIKVIPDVNCYDDRNFDFVLLGIPKNPPAISVQLQTIDRTDKEDVDLIRACVETTCQELKPKELLVYGGSTAIKMLDEMKIDCPYVMIPNRSSARQGVMAQSSITK